MNNLKIGTRLILGFFFMLVLVAILAGIGLWRMDGANEMAERVVQVQLKNERMINEWSGLVALNALRIIAASKTTDPATAEYFESAQLESAKRIDQIIESLRSSLDTAEGKSLYEAALEMRATYVNGFSSALEAQRKGDFAAAGRFFEQELEGLLDSYSQAVAHLLSFQQASIDLDALILHDNNDSGTTLLMVVAVLALLGGIAFAVSITRSITRPLRRSVALAETVSSRDLRSTIDVRGTDETSALLRALRQMNESLTGVVHEVQDGAESIATASRQISAGNLDLSSRTEEQASSLAETAATMEQLTTTVKQNADNAQQASQLAQAAADVAARSGTVVTEVVSTMGAISDSSRRVAEIIGVIDTIAFQTNILALNAAVEAARAGEQGRGFAVVAAEVRALAQRSAAAAREIKDLIDTSVATTRAGNELVAEAGSTMQETVASIKRVTDIMSEITSASQEQSVGIEQVNQAVAQMDQVTQQNAALVQQAAAASHSLQEQAAGLARLMATFKLNGEARMADGGKLPAPAQALALAA